jgi:hypothetical protein
MPIQPSVRRLPGAVVWDQTRLGRMKGAARRTAEFWRNWRRELGRGEGEKTG